MNNVKVFITEITPSGIDKYEKRQYDNVVLPFKYGKFLDEQLDYAMFTIERVKKDRFPLLSVCSVEITDDEGTEEVCRNWLLVGDESFESPVGSGMYNHDITLIEATKLAEGIPVESLCFTNPSGNDYTRNAISPTLDVIVEE